MILIKIIKKTYRNLEEGREKSSIGLYNKHLRVQKEPSAIIHAKKLNREW